MATENPALIISGSFNGLLDRIAKIDFFDVWLTGKKILKKAKKERVEATMGMSEVVALTGLTREDIDFFVSLRLIEVVEGGEDQQMAPRALISLVNVFERMFDNRRPADDH